MKKLVLMFSFLTALSTSFVACRDSGDERDVVENDFETETEVMEEPESDFAMNDANDDEMWDEDEYNTFAAGVQ